MIKIQSIKSDTGDNLSITTTSITINDTKYLTDELYIPKGEDGEVLPPIYREDNAIIFNHNIDRTRRHITFICHSGNDKRFLEINIRGLANWSELVDYVNFYNMTDKEQLKFLSDIRNSFLDGKISEGLTLPQAINTWVDKGK